MHKTGTSALQNYFWENRQRCLENGICYPEIALSGPTHAKLANVFKGRDWDAAMQKMMYGHFQEEVNPYGLEAGESADLLYANLRDVVEQSCASIAIVSSECFLEWIDPKCVASYVCGWGWDVKVVIYLRRQDEWIESVFNQVVKDRYIRYSERLSDLPQLSMLDYYMVLTRWAEAFGRENIIVRLYPPGESVEFNIVGDFLEMLEHREGLADRFQEALPHRINPSLHREIVEILCRTNKLSGSRKEHEAILAALQPLNEILLSRDGTHGLRLLSDSERQAIMASYKASNAAVAREYFKEAPDAFERWLTPYNQ